MAQLHEFNTSGPPPSQRRWILVEGRPENDAPSYVFRDNGTHSYVQMTPLEEGQDAVLHLVQVVGKRHLTQIDTHRIALPQNLKGDIQGIGAYQVHFCEPDVHKGILLVVYHLDRISSSVLAVWPDIDDPANNKIQTEIRELAHELDAKLSELLSNLSDSLNEYEV